MSQPVINKMYQDARGCTYYVKRGIGESFEKAQYRAHKRMPDDYLRVCDCPGIKWCDTEEDAQRDLDALAKRRGWTGICSKSIT